MKTAKQLQDAYIRRFMSPRHDSSKDPFCVFVKENIYKGHTIKDRLCKTFGLPDTFDGTLDSLPKRLRTKWEPRWQELQDFVNKDSKEADRRIASRFEWFRLKLNELFHN